MATRNLVPRNSGEGGVGKPSKPWATGYFDNFYISGLSISMDQNVRTTDDVVFSSGNFTEGLTLSGFDVATTIDSIKQTLEEATPFVYFSNAQDNIRLTKKTFYDTPSPETQLSGVTVATAENMKFTLQWDGPNDEYIGEARINGQTIPSGNISELGTDTRRFEGFVDNLNIEGLTELTGEANGRQTTLTITEVGLGPTPVNISIDEVHNATPKPGELLGTTSLKEGDSLNIYVDFDRDDIDSIAVHDYGAAKPIEFSTYPLENTEGIYRATIPISVSNRAGGLSVAVQAIDTFGTTGEIRTSTDFVNESGQRLLDQDYPKILAYEPSDYNGRSDGLRENESTTFSNNISNWINGVDYISYTPLNETISIDYSGDFQNVKTVNYESGIYSDEENIEIYVIKRSNGTTDKIRLTTKIANGPEIISSHIESLASSTTSPHILGTEEVKAGDIVDALLEIDGKGVSINNIEVQSLNHGITDGTSFSSNYSKSVLPNGNFEFSIPITVKGTLGNNSFDGDQSAKFKARNNFLTESDEVTTQQTAKINNGTIPTISIGEVSYPIDQSAIKINESASFSNSVSNYDQISYSSPGDQLDITEPNIFESIKNVNYKNGDYNVSLDNGTNNLKISATKLSNGAVIESESIVNIANAPLQLTVEGLPTLITYGGESPSGQTFFTSENTYNFYLHSNQIMLNAPTLSTNPLQLVASELSHTYSSVTKTSNRFSIIVNDNNTKGSFPWIVSAKNLAGIETTSISYNPNYILSGFSERSIKADPNSLGAGLAYIGTTVSNPNNLTFENLSEGGTATYGGTNYYFQSIEEGTLLNNSFDFNNKFTICNSSGVVDFNGDYVFNLDSLNRAANTSTSNPAEFIIKEN